MKNLHSLIILMFSTQCFSQDFHLSGRMKGCDGNRVYLFENNGRKKLDSTICKNETFVFSGQLEEPKVVRLYVEGDKSYSEFFIENTHFSLITVKGSLSNALIKDSPLNTLYNQYNDEIAMPIRLQLVKSSIDKSNLSLPDDSLKLIIIDKNIDSLAAQSLASIVDLINKHRSSFLSLFFLDIQYGAIGLEKSIKLLSNLSDEVKTTPTGKKLAATMNKIGKLMIGDMAPVFELKNEKGNTIALKQFVGKKVFIDFWASWCGPCRKEHPELVQLYEQSRNMNIEFISISTDENDNQWKKAIIKDQLKWFQVIDEVYPDGLTTANKYGIYGIPSNILVDEKGMILAKNMNMEDLRRYLKDMK